ncbi:DnaJ-domain-containing protein [Xylariaceae sp. FL0662B]|nr:DnaJ-domain-containing protein [Xylariaceae sp. FL0662B]
MGAQQSSGRGAAASDSPPKRVDYYELLGLDRQASDDEIKKAYRRKALELHPDRNFGDVENATQRFAEVQAAYEVLSDPQERAWYDSHRDAILRGDDPADTEAAPEFYDVRLVTADEIYTLIARFNKAVPLDDSPNSFFTILQSVFERIAQGENAAADWDGLTPIEYPSFGSSKDNDKIAKAFYSRWANFSTRLSFAWKDKWRLSDAPDRRIRRLMEKENKKLREDAAREFNDAVRSLVAFVRKRDPRYVPNTQSEAERQKILRDSAAAQAARSRAANQEKMNDVFAIPEWAQAKDNELHQGYFSESEEESEVEHIECVVCNKTFKSEKQYEAHEKSKKHLKAVQQLQRQMKKENANLDLDEAFAPEMPVTDDFDGGNTDEASNTDKMGETNITDTAQTEASSRLDAASRTDTEPASSRITTVDSEDESEDNDYASRDVVEARLALGSGNSYDDMGDSAEHLAGDVEGISLAEDKRSAKKIGKAKAKRAKRAAREAEADPMSAVDSQNQQKCTTCNATFDSRTKLFKHLDQTRHAAIKTVASKPGKKRR